MSGGSNFDWSDDEDIIVEEQRSIAIYRCTNGNLIIRQERSWHEEDDTFIHVAPCHAVAVAYALLDAAGLDVNITERVGDSASFRDIPRPLTASDQRKIHGCGSDSTEAQEELEQGDEPDCGSPEASHMAERAPLKERRARAAAILQADPSRSNRSIAAECDLSDKTVAAIRAELSAETCAETGADVDAEDGSSAEKGAEPGAEVPPLVLSGE